MTGIILAYDKSDVTKKDTVLLRSLRKHYTLLKIGLEAMCCEREADGGVTLARMMRKYAGDTLKKCVMWDAKLADISNTMEGALRNIVNMRPQPTMVTLHASNVSDNALMLASQICGDKVLPLAVTVLTDLDDEQCISRFGTTPDKAVLRFAQNAKKQGIRGLVCAPRELAYLREHGALEGITTVIPGTRSKGASANDQKRPMTPAEAVGLGANYLVIGREVMTAFDPLEAIRNINNQIGNYELAS